MELGYKRKVELIKDLTKYDSRCTIGSIGWTIPNVKLSMWGSSDNFVAVKFDNGARLDIALNSLNMVDEIKVKEFNLKNYPKLKTLEKRALKLKEQHSKLMSYACDILIDNKIESHEENIRKEIQSSLKNW